MQPDTPIYHPSVPAPARSFLSTSVYFMFLFAWWLSSLWSETSPYLSATRVQDVDVTSILGPLGSDTQDPRPILDILQNCLTTWFLCAWVVIHPNIPCPDESSFNALWRRIDLMIWEMLFPELILWWAIKQWAGAKVIKAEYSAMGYDWTMAHGFYMIMGGFTLYDGKTNLGVLSFDRFKKLYNNGAIDFPEITEAEINDKSCADTLSKFITLLQTTWFVVQYARRAVYHLPITELEVVTLAQCAFPAVLYYFWWYKPFSVYTSTKVRLRPSARFQYDPAWVVRSAPPPVAKKVDPLGTIIDIVAFPVTIALSVLYKCRKILGSNTIKDGADHVPRFYAPDLVDWRTESFGLGVAVSTGTLFGAVHCLAWYFEMPTPEEVQWWRGASVLLTAIPLMEMGTGVVAYSLDPPSSQPGVVTYMETFMPMFTTLSFLLYPLLRCYLLFDALYLLRHRLPFLV